MKTFFSVLVGAAALTTGALAQGKNRGGKGVMDLDSNGNSKPSSLAQTRKTKTYKKHVHDLRTEEECNEAMNTKWYDGYLDEAPDPVCHCGVVGAHHGSWKRRFNGCLPDHRQIEGSGAMYLTKKEQCEMAMSEWTPNEEGMGNDDAADNGGSCSCPEDRWDKRAWLCNKDPIV